MTLTVELRDQFVADYGRYLFYATDIAHVDSIRRLGICPESASEGSATHIHIASWGIADAWAAERFGAEGALIRVDLTVLEPERIDPDPDGLGTPMHVIENGLLGLDASGRPAADASEVVRWVGKDSYWLSGPVEAWRTAQALERYPSVAYRGDLPARAVSGARRGFAYLLTHTSTPGVGGAPLAPLDEPQTPAPSEPAVPWSAEAHFDAAFARVTERLSHDER
jgi:hypothetical protein